MVYRAVRSEELCRGGKDGPDGCPAAHEVTCAKCKQRRVVEDTDVPGKCPECGSAAWQVERCPDCPLDDLDYVRTHSVAGHLLSRLLDLEFTVERFQVPWSEITAEEVKGLQVLREEREKYQEELRQRERQRTSG